MKYVQQMINVLLAIVGLTIINILGSILIKDKLTMENLLAKKQSVISCGYNQSKGDYNSDYKVNSNIQSYISYSIPFDKLRAGQPKDNGEGNGCSHQSSDGALLCGSFSRKQLNNCTGS